MTSTEKDLILRSAGGDASAFEELFRRHFEAVFNYARLLTDDPAAAEDLTQDAFIRAHAAISRLGPPWRFRAWIFRLTRNRFLDTIRRGRPESELQEETVDEAITGPEAAAVRREDSARVRLALAHLPSVQREALVLREVYELSYADIGEVTGLSPANVKVTLHRARARFQETYGLKLLLEEPTPECAEISEALGEARDGELPEARMRSLRRHLKACGACRERRDRLTRVAALIVAPLPAAPPAGLAERILKSLPKPPGGPAAPSPGEPASPTGGEIMSPTRRWIAAGCLAVAAAVVAGAGYLALGSYRAYAAQLEALPGDETQAWFLNPANGSTFPVGAMTLVQARADGPSPIGSMELWVDGQITEVVGAPGADGLVPFPADFHWQADAVGTYELVARAHTLEGETATSPALFLNVVEPEAVVPTELDQAYSTGPGYPIPSGPGGGGPPNPGEPPPPSDPPPAPSEPGEVVDLLRPTFTGWLGFLFPRPGSPAAPKLTPAVEGCKIRLFISDNSDNENGFRVFRRDPGATEFALVATLAPYPGPTFTYEDLDMYGSYAYYVTAFNMNGQTSSNLVTVEVDSPNCAPPFATALIFQLGPIAPQTQPDMGYCYYSFDDMVWYRHPADPDAFLPPGADGFGLDGLGEFAAITDEGGPAKIAVECWGWIGGGLQKLGEWQATSGGGAPPPDSPDIDIGIDPGTIQPGVKPGVWFPAPSFYVPIPNVWIGTGPQECAQWSNIPNPFILGLICGDVADDIDFAVWNLKPCLSIGQTQCFSPDEVTKYRVYDTQHNNGLSVAQTVKAPATLYFLLDETSCEPRTVWVSAVVEKDGQTHEGPRSQGTHYPGNPNCPYVLGQVPKKYRITWETIDFSVGNIDDGADAEDDAEGYGYLKLGTETGSEMFWSVSEMTHSLAPDAFGFQHANVYEFEDDSGDNPYLWAVIPLSKSAVAPCQWILGCSPSVGNHISTFELYRGESAYLKVRLWDADPSHPDDKICHANSGAINDGLLTSHGGVYHGTMNASHSSASCQVKYTIEALP